METFCDPGNSLRAPGAFGDRSVVEFPGYRAPAWCDDEPLGGQLLEVAVPSSRLRTDLSAKIWTSRDADPEAPLPLLVAHDGSEYAHLSQLLRLLDRMTQAGRLPPLRAVLLDPVDRNEHYSASAAYAQAVAGEVLPALAWLAPNGRHPVVGMGASLGALAMLHVHRSRPSAFAGLFLQSSSFFRQRYDRQESGFPRFRRIARFVGEVLNASSAERAIPVTLTCGAVEENLANNRAVTRALRRQGYEARLHVSRDAHNYIAWRDTFDPNLVDLLARVWR
ncbi:MAG: alpha/beta hydrolase-fold protein [Actinomycetota bacterium]|nr:alpha/beta hydrolase-fold protein [Actinomycetota bacterium]